VGLLRAEKNQLEVELEDTKQRLVEALSENAKFRSTGGTSIVRLSSSSSSSALEVERVRSELTRRIAELESALA
jgi:hypothetical protein